MDKLINCITAAAAGSGAGGVGGHGEAEIQAELADCLSCTGGTVESLSQAQALVSTVTLHTSNVKVLTQVAEFLCHRLSFPMVDVGRAFLECQMVSMRDIRSSFEHFT